MRRYGTPYNRSNNCCYIFCALCMCHFIPLPSNRNLYHSQSNRPDGRHFYAKVCSFSVNSFKKGPRSCDTSHLCIIVLNTKYITSGKFIVYVQHNVPDFVVVQSSSIPSSISSNCGISMFTCSFFLSSIVSLLSPLPISSPFLL